MYVYVINVPSTYTYMSTIIKLSAEIGTYAKWPKGEELLNSLGQMCKVLVFDLFACQMPLGTSHQPLV